MVFRVGGSRESSRTGVWGDQQPYLRDIYSNAANMYYGGGSGGGGLWPSPYGIPSNPVQAGGGGGFHQSPTQGGGQMVAGASGPYMPGGTSMGPAAPGMRATPGGTPMGAPPAAAFTEPMPDPQDPQYGGYSDYQRALEQWRARRDAAQGAAAPGPQSPAPGIPPGGGAGAPMPPWMQQGMAGGSQAFGSLVNATDPGNNPYFGSAVNAALDPLFQRFTQQVLPGLNMGAVGAGQSRDSSRNQIAQGLATQSLMNTAGNVVAGMGNQAYGQGLNAAQAALQLNPYGNTPWDHLMQYRQAIGDPVMTSRGSGSSASIGIRPMP